MSDAINISLRRHRVHVATEHLLGMAQGMLADGQLHDREIQFLSAWLSNNQEAAEEWPVSAVAARVRDILVDGVITEAERNHLTQTLRDLLANDFADTGSASPEPTRLPLQDHAEVVIESAGVCHTGEFAYGTRVSPDWAHTSYGRKIERAVELQEQGHPLFIISEQRWLQALGK